MNTVEGSKVSGRGERDAHIEEVEFYLKILPALPELSLRRSRDDVA